MREATVFEVFITAYIIGVGVYLFGSLFFGFCAYRPNQSEEEVKQAIKSFYKAPFWPLYLALDFISYMIKSCDILIEDIKKFALK